MGLTRQFFAYCPVGCLLYISKRTTFTTICKGLSSGLVLLQYHRSGLSLTTPWNIHSHTHCLFLSVLLTRFATWASKHSETKPHNPVLHAAAGPAIPWRPGRVDKAADTDCPPNGRLPDAAQVWGAEDRGWGQLQMFFAGGGEGAGHVPHL
jgi:hypothetical protein